MKNRLLPLLIFVAFAAAATGVPRAKVPVPTPSPDPHTYADPAMNFTAPPEAVLMGRRTVALKDLGNDLETLASWVIHPGKENAYTINLSMEGFVGPPDQWEAQFESQTHSSNDDVMIRNKTPMALTNGMPATFVEVSYGSGFDSRKQFAVVWADGQRGIVLSVISRLGDVSADQAKAMLHDVSATAYPVNEP